MRNVAILAVLLLITSCTPGRYRNWAENSSETDVVQRLTALSASPEADPDELAALRTRLSDFDKRYRPDSTISDLRTIYEARKEEVTQRQKEVNAQRSIAVARVTVEALNAKAPPIDQLFPKVKGEFEKRADYERRISGIDLTGTRYIEAEATLESYDVDAQRGKVSIAVDQTCASNGLFPECPDKNLAVKVGADVNYSQYTGSNAFGAKTNVVAAKGVEYYLQFPQEIIVESANGVAHTPTSGKLTLELELAPELAKRIRNGKAKLLAAIGVEIYADPGSDVTAFFHSEPKFNAPVDAALIHRSRKAKIKSLSIMQVPQRDVVATYLARGETASSWFRKTRDGLCLESSDPRYAGLTSYEGYRYLTDCMASGGRRADF